jgi:Protein of unknown function (DUF4236)
MGFTFRRSVRVGPFRVNVSRSGLGLSLGGDAFRVGSSPRRRRYTTFSLPGTGVGYRTSGRGCAVWLIALGGAGTWVAAEAVWRVL